MEKNIKDIESDALFLLSEAYDRGYNKGKQEQFSINEKLSNPKVILKDFVGYVKQFKLILYNEEKLFSNGEHLMTDDSLISNFLLSRDYNQED